MESRAASDNRRTLAAGPNVSKSADRPIWARRSESVVPEAWGFFRRSPNRRGDRARRGEEAKLRRRSRNQARPSREACRRIARRPRIAGGASWRMRSREIAAIISGVWIPAMVRIAKKGDQGPGPAVSARANRRNRGFQAESSAPTYELRPMSGVRKWPIASRNKAP